MALAQLQRPADCRLGALGLQVGDHGPHGGSVGFEVGAGSVDGGLDQRHGGLVKFVQIV